MKYQYFKIGFQHDQTPLTWTVYIFWFSDVHTTGSCSMTGFGVLLSDFWWLKQDEMCVENVHLKYWTHILSTARGFEDHSKNGGGVWYLRMETSLCSWSVKSNPQTKVDITGFLLVYAVQIRLMKGHGAGVTIEKCMRTDLFFFFFFFLRLDPRIFPPFSSLFLFFSSPLFCVFLPHGYLGRARLV